MQTNPVRTILQLLAGTAEMTRDRATDIASVLLSAPGVAPAGQFAEQVSTLADELLAAVNANRELVQETVREELESALNKFGLATHAEVLAAHTETQRLVAEVRRLRHVLLAAGVQDVAANAAGGDDIRDLDSRAYEILGYESGDTLSDEFPPAPDYPSSSGAVVEVSEFILVDDLPDEPYAEEPAGPLEVAADIARDAVAPHVPARKRAARRDDDGQVSDSARSAASRSTTASGSKQMAAAKKSANRSAKKSPTKKSPANKATTTKKTSKTAATKKAPVKKAAGKKAPIKKASTRKAPVKAASNAARSTSSTSGETR